MTLIDGMGAETEVRLSARDTSRVVVFAGSVLVALLTMAGTGAWYAASMHARVLALETTLERSVKDGALSADALGKITTDLAVIRERLEALARSAGGR